MGDEPSADAAELYVGGGAFVARETAFCATGTEGTLGIGEVTVTDDAIAAADDALRWSATEAVSGVQLPSCSVWLVAQNQQSWSKLTVATMCPDALELELDPWGGAFPLVATVGFEPTTSRL